MIENISAPLPVPEDMLFQQRVWAAERIGWVVLTIAVLAGLLGVFSDGLASGATVASGDGALQVRYERFERKTARAQFTIRVLRAPSQQMHLRLRSGFIESYVIESLYPQPLRSTAGAQGLELIFARPVPAICRFTSRRVRGALAVSQSRSRLMGWAAWNSSNSSIHRGGTWTP